VLTRGAGLEIERAESPGQVNRSAKGPPGSARGARENQIPPPPTGPPARKQNASLPAVVSKKAGTTLRQSPPLATDRVARSDHLAGRGFSRLPCLGRERMVCQPAGCLMLSALRTTAVPLFLPAPF